MYKTPVVLSSETHGAFKILPVADYSFAKALNSCVLLGQEFLEAAKHYPVLFSRTSDGELTSVALLGISENLFIAGNGSWDPDRYVPAFIRRYPYVLAEGLAGDGSLTICIDSGYPGFNEEEGERLFTDEAAPTAVLSGAIDFLRLYHAQCGVTKGFLNQVNDLGLLKAVDANFTLAGGEKFTMRDLLTVDEELLLGLSDAELAGLVRSGFLPWIYAQLSSTSNFGNIINRAGHVVSQKDA